MLVKKLMQPLESILDWILPARCLLCSYPTQNSYPLCPACRKDLPILPHSCEQCAQFLRFISIDNKKCGNCLTHPPAFQRTYAMFPYQPPIKPWIRQLKFHQQLSYANALGRLMAERIQAQWYRQKPLPDLIIPVPLHDQRMRERGFNQALEIARPISRLLNIPLDYQSVMRKHATIPQTFLPARQRKQNLHQAFSSNKYYYGMHIALIDDVVTTGVTIRECAQLLKNQGSARIEIWCCARNG